ncbi:MAG: WYL domain-containing protein, partial [Thermomonas sp.]
EAVARAIALRAAGASVGGIEATSLRLLGKLDELMPTRLRRRATALHAVTMSLRGGMPPLVDAGMLSDIATACRDARVLRFGYRSHAGERSQRHVQPLRLANYGRRWYLIAWDIDRSDWRSFRVDRIDKVRVTGATFVPRAVPADVATRLERGIAYEPFACRITLRLQGNVDALQAILPVWCGVLEPETDTHSLLRVAADSPESLLAQVLMIGQDVELVEDNAMSPELQQVLARMGALFAGAPTASV